MVGTNGVLSHQKSSSDPAKDFNCKVRLLDEDQKPLIIRVRREWIGRQLFEEVCRQVGGLAESDYFGLRYLDRKGERQWLDLRTNIFQQLRYTVPCVVSFRVKHYPPVPMDDLRQEISRYYLYLQLRRDLQHGRLLCSPTDAQELAACVAQAELGDQCQLNDPQASIAELRLLPNLSPQVLSRVCEMHAQMKGCVSIEAEAEFLEKVSRLDTYGVDPYPVKDQKGNTLYLGLTHEGVATFRGNRRSHLFRWGEITKFSYDRRIFIIHVTLREDTPLQRKIDSPRRNSDTDVEEKKHVLGFKCQSRRTAAAIWRWAIDRNYFFTLSKGADARRHKSGGGILRRGNTYRFSGRSREETLRMSQTLTDKPQPPFMRTSSCRHISNRKDSDHPTSATLPRSRSEQHPTFCNGSSDQKSNGGTCVQFLLTSTPVKSRPTLLLHKSADELTSDSNRYSNGRQIIREINVNEKAVLDQHQVKGLSEPDLSQSTDSTEQCEDFTVALSGIEVVTPVVQAPLASSQTSIVDSPRMSIQESPITEEMTQLTARKESSQPPFDEDGYVVDESVGNPATWKAPLASCEPELTDKEEDQSPVPFWKALLFILTIFSFLTMLGSILVFEGELHSSVLNKLRTSSYMEGLYQNVYRPMRRRVLG